MRATHDFLDETTINEIKAALIPDYFPHADLYAVVDHSSLVGFIGLRENTIEMLFIDSESRSRGYGSSLIEFAIQKGATKVDVNKQSPQYSMTGDIQLIVAGNHHDGGVGITAEEAEVVGDVKGEQAEAAHHEDHAAAVRPEEFAEGLLETLFHPALAVGDAGLDQYVFHEIHVVRDHRGDAGIPFPRDNQLQACLPLG